MSVLLDYSKQVKIKSLDAKSLKEAFEKTIKTVKIPRWDPLQGLKYEGKKKDGLFRGYEDPRLDTIFLERKLFTAYGDTGDDEISTQSNRLITFLHEALHKLIFELSGRKKLTKKDEALEESLITRMLIRYFNDLPHQILSMEVTEKLAAASAIVIGINHSKQEVRIWLLL